MCSIGLVNTVAGLIGWNNASIPSVKTSSPNIALAGGVTSPSNRTSTARGTWGVGVIVGVLETEGVSVIVGVRVIVDERAMVGDGVIVGVEEIVGVMGKYSVAADSPKILIRIPIPIKNAVVINNFQPRINLSRRIRKKGKLPESRKFR